MANREKILIGRAEHIVLIDFSDQPLPAKVDTGADRSSIWASKVQRKGENLQFVLFDQDSRYYTGKVIELPSSKFSRIMVENSFGHREPRYLVHLRVRLAGRLVRASFTLANRSSKTYPILLGRRLLAGKYVVDVSTGTPLKKLEQNKRKELEDSIKENEVET